MAVNQLKAGVVLSYAVLALTNIVALLYTPYMLRMMGQSEFGLYSLAASIIAYLTILDVGFGSAIVRYTAKFRAERKKDEQYSMFGMFVILYIIFGIVAFLIGLALYFNVDALFGNSMTQEELDKARIMILITAFNLAVTLPLSIFGSIITAYENFIFQKLVQLARIILNTIAMIAILENGYRAIGMVVVVTIFNLATLSLNYWYCMHKIKIKIYFHKFQWGLLKGMATYSFFIFLTIIVDRIFWSTGQFVLGVQIGTAAIAVFAVAIQLETMYMSFSLAISGVFLPKVTALVVNKQSKKVISDLFIRTGRIQYIVMSFILTGFIVFGKQFVLLWAGVDYSEVYIIALLFFIPLTVPLIQNLGVTILEARNQMKFRAILYIAIALCSLLLQISLTKYYGAVGTAISISIALIVGNVFIMNIYYFKVQEIDIPKFWQEIANMSLVPIMAGGLAYFLIGIYPLDTVLDLIIGIFLFSIVYIPAFWRIGMNQYERDLLGKPLKKILSKYI